MRKYVDGEPCDHPGCCHHVTHPCEGCGRIGCKSFNHKNESYSPGITLVSEINDNRARHEKVIRKCALKSDW